MGMFNGWPMAYFRSGMRLRFKVATLGSLFWGKGLPTSARAETANRRPWATFIVISLLAGAGMVGLTALVALNERQSTIDRVKASNLPEQSAGSAIPSFLHNRECIDERLMFRYE